MNEINEMKRVFWKAMLFQLALVEGIDKQTNCTVQGIWTTGKASRRTSEPSQIMSEFSVIAFDRIGVRFPFRNSVATPVIP